MITAAQTPPRRSHRLDSLQPISGSLALAGLLIASIVWSSLAATGSTANAATDAAPSEDIASAFLAEHCHACHGGPEPEGALRLESLSRDFADKDIRARWLAVLEQVRAGNMPPVEQSRPAAEDVEALAGWIHTRVAAAENAQRASDGRVVLRRLNQNEYTNTVRDLLDVEVELNDLLPPDTSTSGFDNSAGALHVSSYLLDNYLEAADRVLDAAIANGPRPPTIKRRYDIKDERTVKPTGSVYRHLDDGVAIFASSVAANIQVTLWQFQTRQPGRYRFRISGCGFQTDEPVTFHVKGGPMNAAAQQYLIGYFDVPAGEPTVVEFVTAMEGRHTIRIVADRLETTREVEQVGAEHYTGPGLAVQWVEVEGPLLENWPPKSHRLLLGDLQQEPVAGDSDRLEVVSQQPIIDAERILRNFARRAFRRTVTDDDVEPFLARVGTQLEQGYSFEQALRVGLKGVLVSPHFLFLREKTVGADQAAPEDGSVPLAASGALDDFALASRLSYFLWSSMPDEQLLTLAEQGKLRQPDSLRAQVERMLEDPKAEAFTMNFAGQWLGLRAIDDTTPDRTLYPEYDDVLKVSMVKEALLFFDELLENDLSVTNFIASDFTMLNGPLAEHYGIPDVDQGLKFGRVTLSPESHRGGVLTMAAVLKVTANGTTSSPILRGAWVLDRILGTPPPKPTMDIEAVEPDIRGATTIRDQLAKHRQEPACATCHVRIDPPGFALESFDVIGGWREHYRSVGAGEPVTIEGRRMRYRNGPRVDAADELPDGRQFEDIDQYKQLLLDDKDQLARALTEKLLAYATGAAPTTADQPEVQAVVGRIRDHDYGLRTLVHEVVQSRIFQHK